MTKRRYVDFSLAPQTPTDVAEMAERAHSLGFAMAGLTVDASTSRGQVTSMRRLFREQGVDLFTRVEIAPRSRMGLLKSLRRIRGGFEAVSVRCLSNAVALVAARDNRVDSVLFSPTRSPRMKDGVASIAKNMLQVDLSELIGTRENRSRILSNVSRDVRTALRHRMAVVASSGAKDAFGQRAPLALSALLNCLGLNSGQAVDAISSNAMTRIDENRKKLSSDFVEVGVRIVERSGSSW